MIVGEHSHVGANSVVTSDVAPWSTVAGAPARVISENRRSAT
jgi:acetyltransferase-like isoleucine patch superfamily enzyme